MIMNSKYVRIHNDTLAAYLRTFIYEYWDNEKPQAEKPVTWPSLEQEQV
jgi:hypothetical protein